VTAPTESQEALEAGVQEIEELIVRLEWISASFRRLRGDLALTEGRIAAIAQSMRGARDNGQLALQGLREGR
jgi:hypothetical protein